jgi:hypothetical protein
VRNLFYALLVANVMFFGWAHWVDRPEDIAAVATPGPAVPALEVTTVPPAPVKPTTHCRSVGPFTDSAAAAPTLEALHGAGLQPHPRNLESSTPDGYWVYVEDLKDAAARHKLIAALNAAGMHDAAVMPDESERVSVGVFSDQRHAVHRAEQVQELGYKPTLSVHQKSVSALWFDIDLKPGQSDPSPVVPSPPTNPAKGAATTPVVLPPEVIDCPVKSALG